MYTKYNVYKVCEKGDVILIDWYIDYSVEGTPAVDEVLGDAQLVPSLVDELADVSGLEGFVGPGLDCRPTDLLAE